MEKLDEAIEGSRRASLDDRMDALEDNGEAARGKGDISVPVCALASCRAQPLIAVGLCHGAVHIVFVKEVNSAVWAIFVERVGPLLITPIQDNIISDMVLCRLGTGERK